MATMRDLISDTRRQVFGALTDQMNVLATNYVAGATEVVLDMDINGITAGKTITLGLNVLYVRGMDAASKTVFVVPGYDNSPQEDCASGTFAYINPRVTDWYLFNQLNSEIKRMSASDSGLYRIASWESPADPTWQTYDVPPEAFGMTALLRVRYRLPGSTDVWFDIPSRSYRTQFGDTGAIIRMLRSIPSGTTLQFFYKAPFVPAGAVVDDIETVCGLTPTMQDIPVLGATFRLMRTTESQRNQITSQGDSRRPGEVASMSNLQTSQLIERDYEKRLREEAGRLLQRNPYKLEW